MSFIKKIRRGVRGVVKFADHGLAKLGSGIGAGGKFIAAAHQLYRDGKHELLKHAPALAGVVRAIEHSPLGVAVDGARGQLENLASDAQFAIKNARTVTHQKGQQADAHAARAEASFNKARTAAQPLHDAVTDFVYGRNQDYGEAPAPNEGRWVT